MSDDLDLRAIHRRHEPDPHFVAALGDRLEAILASSASADVSPEEGRAVVELEPADSQRRRGRHRSRRVFAAAVVLAAASVAAFAVVAALDRTPREDLHGYYGGLQPNGWVAFTQEDSGDDADVYLVREGEPPTRVAGSDGDTSDQACPAFSPDGGRLAFGQATRSGSGYEDDAALVIIGVEADGSTSGTTTISVGDLGRPPCAIWSPDGRWVAFGAGSQVDAESGVWLLNTVTEELRPLPGHFATDFDWRPGTDELAIAADGIHIYSVTTGEVRSLGVEDARWLSWSPDGSTIAVQDEHMSTGLSLIDADGTNERGLTGDHLENSGTGPVWSPDGRYIAYQRLIDGGGLMHEVVLVTATDTDRAAPFGTEVVISPPITPGPDGPWSPWSVSWSPDGSMLLYNAWASRCADGVSRCAGLVAVPVDPTEAPFVLADPSWSVAHHDGRPWLPTQTWGRQPSD